LKQIILPHSQLRYTSSPSAQTGPPALGKRAASKVNWQKKQANSHKATYR